MKFSHHTVGDWTVINADAEERDILNLSTATRKGYVTLHVWGSAEECAKQLRALAEQVWPSLKPAEDAAKIANYEATLDAMCCWSDVATSWGGLDDPEGAKIARTALGYAIGDRPFPKGQTPRNREETVQ